MSRSTVWHSRFSVPGDQLVPGSCPAAPARPWCRLSAHSVPVLARIAATSRPSGRLALRVQPNPTIGAATATTPATAASAAFFATLSVSKFRFLIIASTRLLQVRPSHPRHPLQRRRDIHPANIENPLRINPRLAPEPHHLFIASPLPLIHQPCNPSSNHHQRTEHRELHQHMNRSRQIIATPYMTKLMSQNRLLSCSATQFAPPIPPAAAAPAGKTPKHPGAQLTSPPKPAPERENRAPSSEPPEPPAPSEATPIPHQQKDRQEPRASCSPIANRNRPPLNPAAQQ